MATRISGGVCNKYIHIDLVLEETSTNIDDNTSMVAWKLVGYMGSGGSSSYWYSNNYHTINVKINGDTVYSLANTTKSLISIGTNSTQESPTIIAVGSKKVPHNSDGSKICSASFSVAYRYSTAFRWSGAGSITLTSLARASVPSVGASSFEFGAELPILTNRASTAFTHKLYYQVADNDDVLIAEGIGDSYTWIVPLDLLNHFPTSTNGTITFRLDTYSGSTLVGSNTMPIKFLVPKSIVPVIDYITVDDATGYYYKYADFIKYHSKPKVYVYASEAYSSPIVNYSIVVDGVPYTHNNCEAGCVQKEEFEITATITDARGRTATVTETRTAYPYTVPTINNFRAYRATRGSGGFVEDAEGAYIRIEVDAAIDPITVGSTNYNSKEFKLEYKKTTDDEWIAFKVYTDDYAWVANNTILSDTNSMYNVRLTVTDDFAEATHTVTVGTAFTLMDFNASGKGVAFGKVSEQDAFECALLAIFKSCTTEAGADLDALAADVAAIKEHLGI